MFIQLKQTLKLCTFLVALTLIPIKAWSAADAPPCTKIGNIYLPSAFEIALIKGEDPDYTDLCPEFSKHTSKNRLV